MAGFKDVFQRIEVKYLPDDEQYTQLMKKLENMAKVDSYGKTSIQNIYFDTPDFKLIERSLEKPVYKEKLRLRSYGTAKDDTTGIFIPRNEIKSHSYNFWLTAFSYLFSSTILANTQFHRSPSTKTLSDITDFILRTDHATANYNPFAFERTREGVKITPL